MKALKENLNGIIICLFELVVGILLLINPIGFTSGIIIAAGIILSMSGLINCIKYFRTGVIEASRGQFLTKGLIAMLAGAFCIFNSQWFIATFSALTVIYGIVVLLSALEKVQLCVDLIRLKRKKWYLAALSAVISLICAVIILKSPFESTTLLWIFAGISLILEAVFDVYSLMANHKGRVENNMDTGVHNVIEDERDSKKDSKKVNTEDVDSEESNTEDVDSEENNTEDMEEK